MIAGSRGFYEDGPGHAVIIGGSIAGMCAARALRSRFGKVTILEQDNLPRSAQGRRGTPQALHNHFLLDVGRDSIEKLLPGFTDRLLANGGLELDPGYDAASCLVSGWMPRARTNMSSLFASRPTIEATMRELVQNDPGIEFREGIRVAGPLSVGEGSDAVVTGVGYLDSGTGTRGELAADFIVDASGRGSRSARWMRELGFEVEELTLDAKVGYSSRMYRLPDERISWWKFMTVFPESDPKAPGSQQYICIIFPIENNCIVAMMGSWGLPVPSDVESFERSARETRSKEFGRVLDASTPLTGVHHTRSTRNVWRRFDRLSAPPRGFIAVGDAVCAFNPIYAQGMSAAAVSGLLVEQLVHRIDPYSAEFPAAFYAEQARVLQRPWSLAVARDSGYEHARGTEVIADGLRKNILRRLTWPAFQFLAEAIWQDSVVDNHFNRVLNIQESLSDFLTNPRVLAGLGLYGAKKLLRLTNMPPPVPAHRPPPDTDYSPLRGLARHEPVSVPEGLR